MVIISCSCIYEQYFTYWIQNAYSYLCLVLVNYLKYLVKTTIKNGRGYVCVKTYIGQ